ncbi:MAG: peptide chain release factor N(5)-glutamine methyltransferase [Pseudomonadota bacterium]
MTVGEALRVATARLNAAGVAGAAGDARRLMAHMVGRIAPDDPVLDRDRWEALVAARAARQPVSQIVGRRAFWRHEFRVTSDTLDPRPETETLVQAALEETFARVLDLGTGTGCILLSLLAERSEATGLGTDLSPAALDVARDNAAVLKLEDRATFRHGDWLSGVDGTFDLIVSNPPYITAAEMAELQPEVRDWEPALALSPGGDGLDAYRVLARDAPAHLAPGGRLIVEVGSRQADAVSALWRAAGLTKIEVRRDLDGRDRVVLGRKAS